MVMNIDAEKLLEFIDSINPWSYSSKKMMEDYIHRNKTADKKPFKVEDIINLIKIKIAVYDCPELRFTKNALEILLDDILEEELVEEKPEELDEGELYRMRLKAWAMSFDAWTISDRNQIEQYKHLCKEQGISPGYNYEN